MRLSILILVLMSVPRLAAGDFCAVKVHVVDSLGRPASATARLAGADGRVAEVARVVSGEVAFCDFGFGEHTIQIGEGCGSVTLNGIRLVHGIAQQFDVLLNACLTGGDGGVYPPGCLLYVRVSSGDGSKLAQAEAVDSVGITTFHADSFGRLFIGLNSGTSEILRIGAPGYRPEAVNASCRETETIERGVQLQRK